MAAKKLSPEAEQKIRRLLAEGMGTFAVAERFGIHQKTVRVIRAGKVTASNVGKGEVVSMSGTGAVNGR